MIAFLEDLPVLGRLVVWVLELLGLAGAETFFTGLVALLVTAVILIVATIVPGWLVATAIVYVLVRVGPSLLRRAAHVRAFGDVVNTVAIVLPTVVAWETTNLLGAVSAAVGAAVGVVGMQDHLTGLRTTATDPASSDEATDEP